MSMKSKSNCLTLEKESKKIKEKKIALHLFKFNISSFVFQF